MVKTRGRRNLNENRVSSATPRRRSSRLAGLAPDTPPSSLHNNSTRKSKQSNAQVLPSSNESSSDDFVQSDNLPSTPKAPNTSTRKRKQSSAHEVSSSSSDDSDYEDNPPSTSTARRRTNPASSSRLQRTSDQSPSANTTEISPNPAQTGNDGYNSSTLLESPSSEEDSNLERVSAVLHRIANRRTRRSNDGRRRFAERRKDKIAIHHPYILNVWDKLKDEVNYEVKTSEQPSDLKLKLLPYQLESMEWFKKQEASEIKGGILADEMGMGKTIQMISLLLSDRGSGPCLVVAPTVAVLQWKEEIETHTGNLLKVFLYIGNKREIPISELTKYDVILTNYSILEYGFRRQEPGLRRKNADGTYYYFKEPSILHSFNWHRVILDEAHSIKDRVCKTAKAAFALKAMYRWCLTGTPLQNRIGELYSLLRFLQTDPYSYYFCTECECKSQKWKFTDYRSCDDCGHRPMSHFCWWNIEILKPIQREGTKGEGAEAFRKLSLLLDSIMLRRTKIERASDLKLPPKHIKILKSYFNPHEMDLYESLYSDTKRQFTTYVQEGTVLNHYANIFELLSKMRQAADHPDMVVAKIEKNRENHYVCVICHEQAEDPIISKCKHIFCREDAREYLQTNFLEANNSSFAALDIDLGEGENLKSAPPCPKCFAKLSIDLSQPPLEEEEEMRQPDKSIVHKMNIDNWRSSTKIETLVEELTKLRKKEKTTKAIVFSQFVNFLEIIQWRLGRSGFRCVKLDGRMNVYQRQEMIKTFTTDPDVTVFLISLKAGGIALNLTEASRVYICDPWWNPAAEDQAMDRIHRLGQCRTIEVYRIIIENSIESRILQLQEKKKAMFESTVGKDMTALSKLTEDDLRFLFVL